MSQRVRHYSMYFFGSLIGVAMFVAVSIGVPMIFAQGAPPAGGADPDPVPLSAADQNCINAMPAIFAEEQKKFVQFMNDHFKNQAVNSALLQTGLDRLKNYRSVLFTARNKYTLASVYQSDAAAESTHCGQAVLNQIKIAEETFQTFVQETAYAKRSTAMAEKIAGINGKLRTLHDLLVQLDGYFASFDSALPGFTQKCVKKDGSTTP